MKKKTNEEYIDELHIKNPNVEVVEQYIDTNTKIMHHCLIHDVHWMAKPANVLQGSGCDICKKEKFLAKRRKTQEQYETEVSKISSHIAVLGSYVDARTPILHKSIKHFGGDDGFFIRTKHDKIKNNYCQSNDIIMIRIPYFKNVSDELNNFLFI